MKPPRYPACPARWRSSFSSSVSGQVKPANSTRVPYTTAGRCAQTIRGHRQVRRTPPTTKPINSRWATTTRSAPARYNIFSPAGTTYPAPQQVYRQDQLASAMPSIAALIPVAVAYRGCLLLVDSGVRCTSSAWPGVAAGAGHLPVQVEHPAGERGPGVVLGGAACAGGQAAGRRRIAQHAVDGSAEGGGVTRRDQQPVDVVVHEVGHPADGGGHQR